MANGESKVNCYQLIEAEWRIYASFNRVIIGSDNGLSPVGRKAIICTNAAVLLIGPLGTNFSEILIRIQTFSFKKMQLKMSSAKRCPFCLGLNEMIPVMELNPLEISEQIAMDLITTLICWWPY